MTPAADLEARLTDLAASLDAPQGQGVAGAVIARLRAGDVADGAAVGPRRRPVVGRRLVLGFAVLVAVVTGVVTGPAVADWLGVRGVEVQHADRAGPTTTAAPSESPSGEQLDLGTPVATLAEAEAAAGFAAAVPAALGPPDAIWVDRRGTAPFISLVYDGGPLVTQFDATLAADALIRKTASPETTVEELRIDGEPAMWIEGIHEVAVRAPDGEFVFERLRLSDRVLLVQHGSLTVRIEIAAGMDRDDAVRIAESLPR